MHKKKKVKYKRGFVSMISEYRNQSAIDRFGKEREWVGDVEVVKEREEIKSHRLAAEITSIDH